MAVNFKNLAPEYQCAGGTTSLTWFGVGGSSPAGTTLVAVFAATAASADFNQPPQTITDANANPYELLYFSINNACGASGLFNAVAVYVCQRSALGLFNNELDMPAELQPGDLASAWSFGYQFSSNFAFVTFDAVEFSSANAAPFPLSVDQTGDDDLVIGGAFDAAVTGTPNFIGYLTETPTFVDGRAYGFAEASVALGTDVIATTVNLNAATDVFGFLLAMEGGNSTGGSAATKLVFSMNKGPLPVPPPEGRAIATVQIDCSQQPVQGMVNFPEMTFLDVTELQWVEGFTVLDFDLEHLFQGSGLSEVRSIGYNARPAFNLTNEGREDVPIEQTQVYPALLTNTSTLQSAVIGADASTQINNDIESCWFETGVISFPANKHSLKYRFIVPQMFAANPVGKWVLQFFNFEVPPWVSPSGKMANRID